MLSVGLVLIVAAQSILQRRRHCVQLTHSTSGWVLEFGHTSDGVTGNLVQAGYRSAWLIILVIQSDDGELHRLALWQDQVSSRQFSYLHQQLAFAADPPIRRQPLLWLKDAIGMSDLHP